MAKSKGGGGFVYASLPLEICQDLHDLENEKPGTVGAFVLAYMDYAQDHAHDSEAPADIPDAPDGFSLAARLVWRKVLTGYHAKLSGYIAKVEGGRKAPAGPGRPKGSKNAPKATPADADDPAREDPDEAQEPELLNPEDIRITGMGPWMPSETAIKSTFWAEAVSAGGITEASRPIVNAIATQVWGRLMRCQGFLAPHGMGGTSPEYLLNDLDVLFILWPEDGDTQTVGTRAALLWRVLDSWANLARENCNMSLFDVFCEFKRTTCWGKKIMYSKTGKAPFTQYETADQFLQAMNAAADPPLFGPLNDAK